MALPFIYSNMSDMLRCVFVKKFLNNPLQPLDLLVNKCLVYISNLEEYKNLFIKHFSSGTSSTTKPGCSGPLSSLAPSLLGTTLHCPASERREVRGPGATGPLVTLQCWRGFKQTVQLYVRQSWAEAGEKSLTLSSQSLSSKISNLEGLPLKRFHSGELQRSGQ